MEILSLNRLTSQADVCQVARMADYRPRSYRRQAMQFAQFLRSKTTPGSILTEELGVQIFTLLASNDESLKQKEIQELLGISYSRTKRVLEQLKQEDLIEYDQIPHPHENMPGTYVYRLSPQVRREFEPIELDAANHEEFSLPKCEVPVTKYGELLESLQGMRSSARGELVYLLKLIMDNNMLTMNQAATLTGVRPQNAHSRLLKLINLGAVVREKAQNKEYHYFLAPDVTQEAINKLIEEIGIGNRSTEELKEVPTTMNGDSSQSTDKPTPSGQPKDLAHTLAQKLPEFNPDWPEAVQQRWFESYQKLLEISST